VQHASHAPPFTTLTASGCAQDAVQGLSCMWACIGRQQADSTRLAVAQQRLLVGGAAHACPAHADTNEMTHRAASSKMHSCEQPTHRSLQECCKHKRTTAYSLAAWRSICLLPLKDAPTPRCPFAPISSRFCPLLSSPHLCPRRSHGNISLRDAEKVINVSGRGWQTVEVCARVKIYTEWQTTCCQ